LAFGQVGEKIKVKTETVKWRSAFQFYFRYFVKIWS